MTDKAHPAERPAYPIETPSRVERIWPGMSTRVYALRMDAVGVVATVAGAACALAWVLSLVTRDHSWVDRLWSVLPVVYVWIVASHGRPLDPRLVLMTVLVTLWGARLTANFARKGGYTGTEDYRWAILRGRMPRWAFELFNLLFIVLFQNAVLVLITLPAFAVAAGPTRPLGPLDAVAAAAFVLLLAGETIADQQQWSFHRRKAAPNYEGPRFLQTGLWRFSRHPNFFFEQAQWWVFYAFAATATGSLLHWSIAGPLLLSALFVGSTAFTESITLARYPEYSAYRATTSRTIPMPPRRHPVGAPRAVDG
jgi:steroid 5-alpha reductase family enzyme